MNLYFEMLSKPIFTIDDVCKFYKNTNTARSALQNLVKQNLAVKIRNNMYTCISGETGKVIANKYQIACGISDTAYLSHHTAIEYHGLSKQVSYDIYVTSKTRFREFKFDGYTYKYVPYKTTSDIENIEYSEGVRVTDIEKTLVDSIDYMDSISDMSEVISVIKTVEKLDEKRLYKYLKEYNKQFLYQKSGFLIENYFEGSGITNKFCEVCLEHIEKSKRYLIKNHLNGIYNSKWKMVLPEGGLLIENDNYDYIVKNDNKI